MLQRKVPFIGDSQIPQRIARLFTTTATPLCRHILNLSEAGKPLQLTELTQKEATLSTQDFPNKEFLCKQLVRLQYIFMSNIN